MYPGIHSKIIFYPLLNMTIFDFLYGKTTSCETTRMDGIQLQEMQLGWRHMEIYPLGTPKTI